MIHQRIKPALLSSLFLLSLATSHGAKAEYYGLLHGRLADVSRMPTLSADVGVVFADDYQLLGVRANYKLTPIFMVYGNISFGEVGRADGTPFGIGALYTIENLVTGYDIGVKLSYNRASFEFSDISVDSSNTAVELVGSTQAGFGSQGNIDLYGNIGVQRLTTEDESDVELSFGGGAIMPVGPGEVFVGIDFIDDVMFGGGFRYFF